MRFPLPFEITLVVAAMNTLTLFSVDVTFPILFVERSKSRLLNLVIPKSVAYKMISRINK